MKIHVMGHAFKVRSIQFLGFDSVIVTYVDEDQRRDIWMQMSEGEFRNRVFFDGETQVDRLARAKQDLIVKKEE